MHWYFDVLKKYADFSGRARRMELWMFSLISFIITIILNIVDGVIHLQFTVYNWAPIPADASTGAEAMQVPPIELGVLASIYGLAILIPSIAVGVRRLHDTGRTGWWYLLNLVCCVGWVVLFVFYVLPGVKGENKYGSDPIAE